MTSQLIPVHMQSIILLEAEIQQITGYKRPADQVAELRRQGFYRARRSPTTGNIILERDHYQAICSGAKPTSEPRVRAPELKLKPARGS